MISLATKYENVYINTSAYTPERYPESLVRFMKGPGGARSCSAATSR